MMSPTLHGNCLDVEGFGVLIFGGPGSGKSDLSLRLIKSSLNPSIRLVADDRVLVEGDAEGLIASPPEILAGLIEIRGIGVVRIGHLSRTRPGLVVKLTGRKEIERLPEFPLRNTEIK